LEGAAGQIGDGAVREYYRRDFRQRLDEAFPWRPAGRNRHDRGRGGAGRGAFRPAGRSGWGGLPSGGWGGAALGGVRPAPSAPDPALAACILLAVVIHHPALCEEVGEQLASLDMPDTALDALKQEVIAVSAAGAGLDSSELRDHLHRTGHERALARVVDDKVLTLAPFARPTATPRQARTGWRDIWRQLEARRAGEELKLAEDAFAREPTPENLARLRALQTQARAAAEAGSAEGGAEDAGIGRPGP
jgi:hypothetical protein